MTTHTHLECGLCGKEFETGKVHNLCECGGPLLVRYDLRRARQNWSRDWIANGPNSMWRYAPVLPVAKPASVVSLGEGMTPLNRVRGMGARLGMPNLLVKDDGENPTGSFKDRGISCAVSMMKRAGHPESWPSLGGERCWSAGGVRRGGRHRGATFSCQGTCRRPTSSSARRSAPR